MFICFILGIIASISIIVYKGLYFGPWPAVLNTVGMCLIGSVILYVVLQILGSIGGFLIKLALVIIVAGAIIFGGHKLWNSANPTKQLPDINISAITQPVYNWVQKWIH